jgi:hypothetical protein
MYDFYLLNSQWTDIQTNSIFSSDPILLSLGFLLPSSIEMVPQIHLEKSLEGTDSIIFYNTLQILCFPYIDSFILNNKYIYCILDFFTNEGNRFHSKIYFYFT